MENNTLNTILLFTYMAAFVATIMVNDRIKSARNVRK
jgi:hypothetical protein